MYFLVKNKEEFEERMKKTKRESEWGKQEIKTFTSFIIKQKNAPIKGTFLFN